MSLGGWHSRQSKEHERRVQRAEHLAHQVRGTQSGDREENSSLGKTSKDRRANIILTCRYMEKHFHAHYYPNRNIKTVTIRYNYFCSLD